MSEGLPIREKGFGAKGQRPQSGHGCHPDPLWISSINLDELLWFFSFQSHVKTPGLGKPIHEEAPL